MKVNGDLISKNKKIAKAFNDCFGSIVDNLDLHHWQDKISSPPNISGKMNDITKNYEKHPSSCNIKTRYSVITKFSFWPVSVKEIKKIIRDLNTNKADGGEIPAKILKECEFTFDVLTKCANKYI